jgi:uncharacterized Zn finger protein
MGWYSDFYHYEPTERRKVKGGIKAVSKRGRFGQTWWGQRWIDTLEGFDIGARLGRGRSYARSGQVLSIDIEPGCVTSRVQGSRASPYQIAIHLKAYPAADWKKVAQALREQPFFAAKLLAGEMPPGFEALFAAEGLSLFPQRGADLQTDCSCPDWSNPCKHIAAVYYLLAEEFDRDPFLLFRLRGMTREDLLAQILGTPKDAGETHAEPEEQASAPEPITPDARFWQAGALPDDLFGTVRTPPAPAALPKRLGPFPFWRAEDPFLDALEPIYKKASPRGLDLFQGAEQG